MLLRLQLCPLLLLLLLCFVLKTKSALAMSANNAKKVLRSKIKAALKALEEPYVETASASILEKLQGVSQFADSAGVSSYLAMPKGEVNTSGVLRVAFSKDKRVFIPKILGKNPADMYMLEVTAEKLKSFASNSWGIPEPGEEDCIEGMDGSYSGAIDVVIVPGVAFSSSCTRLGHGKGYYGECAILFTSLSGDVKQQNSRKAGQ
jgi:5-formyltetrahydrofolate cyclo-ligase